MKVSIENLAPCKKLIRIDFPAEEVGTTFDELTREFQKYAKLPGFRPGKAPKHLILRSYGDRIEQEVKRQLISNGYRNAIKQEGLHIVGEPDFEEIQFAKNMPFQFVVTIETAPEFELPDYKGLSAKREMRAVTEADIEQALGVLREKKGTFKDLERAVEEGDFVIINYKGSCDGKPITEISPKATRLESAEGFWINVKPESFLPGFSEQLIGARSGEKKKVDVIFADDFSVIELAGKKGTFDVEILQIKEQKLPLMNDAFAKEYGAEDVSALREGILRDLESELKSKIRRDVRNQLLRDLMSRVTCELPESVVEEETKNVVYNIVRENRNRGVSKELIDNQKDEIYSMANSSARERIKSAFVIGKIAAKEGIRAGDEEVKDHIIQLANAYEISPEKMVKQLKERNGISEIQEQIIRAKVMDFLELNANIEDVLPSE